MSADVIYLPTPQQPRTVKEAVALCATADEAKARGEQAWVEVNRLIDADDRSPAMRRAWAAAQAYTLAAALLINSEAEGDAS